MITVTGISESGSNNILRWAIQNGVNIRENSHLAALVNSEMYYNVKLDNVNFYEMFRLTQYHRTKMKICNIHTVTNLTDEELQNRFNTESHQNIKNLLDKFLSISTLIQSDDDINDKLYSSLILPMITTKCDIQIPIGFGDILQSMSNEECKNIFNFEYPSNLDKMIELQSVKEAVLLEVDRCTRNISYGDKLDKFIEVTKYRGLKPDNKTFYKTSLVSFEKEDISNRRTIRNSLFNINQQNMLDNMRIMSSLKSEMKYTFAIQLPIYLMQILESSYDENIVDISMRSSVTNFITNNFYLDENIINKYGLRITESVEELYKMMNKLLNESDFKESVISLLPSSQFTNALITISESSIQTLINQSNPYLQEMFLKIEQIIRSINIDIQKIKE